MFVFSLNTMRRSGFRVMANTAIMDSTSGSFISSIHYMEKKREKRRWEDSRRGKKYLYIHLYIHNAAFLSLLPSRNFLYFGCFLIVSPFPFCIFIFTSYFASPCLSWSYFSHLLYFHVFPPPSMHLLSFHVAVTFSLPCLSLLSVVGGSVSSQPINTNDMPRLSHQKQEKSSRIISLPSHTPLLPLVCLCLPFYLTCVLFFQPVHYKPAVVCVIISFKWFEKTIHLKEEDKTCLKVLIDSLVWCWSLGLNHSSNPTLVSNCNRSGSPCQRAGDRSALRRWNYKCGHYLPT